MNRRLLWQLCLLVTAGIVALFYLINYATSRAEEEMSLLKQADRDELNQWGRQAEALYLSDGEAALETWLQDLQQREQIWAAVVHYEVQHIAGEQRHEDQYMGYNLGRDVEWKIHLYFENNPVMEIPFSAAQTSFLVLLPDRMRPGGDWQTTRLLLQIFLPMVILALLSLLLYRHIMHPLRTLQRATRDFSLGDFSVRVRQQLGTRKDEISELANTFDQMAAKIGEQLVTQRQLIADLSHELRTPLTRLEIATQSALASYPEDQNLQRIQRESRYLRLLTEDTLALAWLDNEQPKLKQEDLDLVDLIDVVVEDARFEFPGRQIIASLPDSAAMTSSSHQAVGQALENILRNALRHTPDGESVEISVAVSVGVSVERLAETAALAERDSVGPAEEPGNPPVFRVTVKDRGPGVPESLLESIFHPFFRVDQSRTGDTSGIGLGLALARRQLKTVGGTVVASSRNGGGLCMTIILPAH